MKKIILSAVTILVFGIANAQDTKVTTDAKGFTAGDVFVSGSIGVNLTKQGDSKRTQFTIAPKAGFFVTGNISIGGRLGYTSIKEKSANLTTNDFSSVSVGAFGRYYVTPKSDFSLFGEALIDYEAFEYHTQSGADGNSVGIAISPGVNYFVSSHFSLEATVGSISYLSTKSNNNAINGEDTTTNQFGINLNLDSINFGVTYKF